MNSGKLDEPFYIFNLSQVRDKASSFVWTWKQDENEDYIWAERIAAEVQQGQANDQNRSERAERLRIRVDERFTAPKARDTVGLFDGTFYYRIAGVKPDLKNDDYVLVDIAYVQNRPVIERVSDSGRIVP